LDRDPAVRPKTCAELATYLEILRLGLSLEGRPVSNGPLARAARAPSWLDAEALTEEMGIFATEQPTDSSGGERTRPERHTAAVHDSPSPAFVQGPCGAAGTTARETSHGKPTPQSVPFHTAKTPPANACKHCGSALGFGALFCIGCGRKTAQGKRLAAVGTAGKPANIRFCTHCGKPLSALEPLCRHCGVAWKGACDEVSKL
jgi:hypothetical protein